MKLQAVSLMLLLAPAPAAAEVLYTEHSAAGETMHAFVLRVSPKAQAYTRDAGVEVCGSIGKQGAGYTLLIKTDSMPLECTVEQVVGEATGYFYHTHTAKGNATWAPADLKTRGYLATPTTLYYRDGRINKSWARSPR